MIKNGIDLVEIHRIKKSIEKPHFIARVYGKNEIAEAEKRQNMASYYAGNFAAKEAFIKCLGTGIKSFKLTEIEVLRNSFGGPYFSLSDNIKSLYPGLIFELSITNTTNYAVASVICYYSE